MKRPSLEMQKSSKENIGLKIVFLTNCLLQQKAELFPRNKKTSGLRNWRHNQALYVLVRLVCCYHHLNLMDLLTRHDKLERHFEM